MLYRTLQSIKKIRDMGKWGCKIIGKLPSVCYQNIFPAWKTTHTPTSKIYE